MGDSRNEKGYEMAPQSDPEKGGADGEISQDQWTGLGKEELLRVADTRAWNWARNILLILFWVGWVAMLIAAIVIVVRVPRCPEVEWWEKSVFYQAFPRSLKDTDGDGIGDLKGIEESLDHLDSIGAKALYLNSIFKERNGTSLDVGYDITDYTGVDMSLGSIEDFDALMNSAADKDIKIILEFVPNHSSDQHPWFLDSRMSKDSEYSDFYVWADGVNGGPPNDWKNAYGESAWVEGQERGQYYYAYFRPEQPDLNYNNDTLRQEILDILGFWLRDHMVDGFVFSHVDYLFEPPVTTGVQDVTPAAGRRRRQAGTTGAGGATTAPGGPTTAMETPNGGETPGAEPEPEPPSKPMPPQYDFLGDGGNMMQEKLFGLLKEWRDLMNEESYLGKYRLMVTQSEGPVSQVASMYGVNKTYLADYPLNTGFLDVFDGELSGESLQMSVKSWMMAKEKVNAEKRWNTWMVGCHDRSRIATRAGAEYVNALNFMLLTLPGTPFVYYGEEIGMKDVAVPADQAQDMVPELYAGEESRDPERTPMPWNNMTNAGFTWENATAYLPLPADAATNNVKMQSKEDYSTMNLFTEVAALHTEPSMVAGKYIDLVADADVFAYIRSFGDWPRYLVVINVGADASHDLYSTFGDSHKLPMEGRVLLSSMGGERSGKKKKDGTRKGKKESLDGLKTKGGEALIIKLK